LTTTKKIPSGINIGAAANETKDKVAAEHLNNRVQRRCLGTELKNDSLKVSLTNRADDIMLNTERKKENSKTVTPLFTNRSFVYI
jgi:hypothetical protein